MTLGFSAHYSHYWLITNNEWIEMNITIYNQMNGAKARANLQIAALDVQAHPEVGFVGTGRNCSSMELQWPFVTLANNAIFNQPQKHRQQANSCHGWFIGHKPESSFLSNVCWVTPSVRHGWNKALPWNLPIMLWKWLAQIKLCGSVMFSWLGTRPVWHTVCSRNLGDLLIFSISYLFSGQDYSG